MPPQANATVTLVKGSGQRDDWDRPGAAGADKWAGTARAYYREATDRDRSSGELNVATRRELIVETALLDEAGIDTDDLITFTVDGAGETTGVAKSIRRSALNGVPPSLQTSKLTLEDA